MLMALAMVLNTTQIQNKFYMHPWHLQQDFPKSVKNSIKMQKY
jgi:hypothetical protein